jgi:hypothetical protein
LSSVSREKALFGFWERKNSRSYSLGVNCTALSSMYTAREIVSINRPLKVIFAGVTLFSPPDRYKNT